MRSSFWDDLDRRLQDPEFRAAYVEESLRIQAVDDAVNAAGGPEALATMGRVKTKQDPVPRGLWHYSAVGGSISVLLGGVASLPFPDPWAVVVWVAVALVLCTCVGLAAPRFFE